ncbi:tRNA(5-methylaminomethyl-2-thiouridylate) methyltransferase [Desulfovibrio sp. OttesenSCG-928-G15]|nr:tRNA(5-methylaminomethyl-2-thiouridylate) methyltransferase [Desulfovibrio sp. OttesenSCG-928-G15]
MTHPASPCAVGLFSGGLDSILAMRLVAEQGIAVTGLHFVSPFFGKPAAIRYWKKTYGFSLKTVDVSEDFAALLSRGPVHGFGSVLNPCVDCKILMLRKAKAIMEESGASFILSGEVLGQRPMSQRRDTLNVIRRDADVKDCLLRPLSALHFEPIAAERTGLVDRTRLLNLAGRGRKEQLELAARMGISEIPTPGGGCLLTEKENGRRYWPLLKYLSGPATPASGKSGPTAADFRLANVGRQYWLSHEQGACWLSIGRNQQDNDSLQQLAQESDYVFKTRDYPGPVAVGRIVAGEWQDAFVASAAAFVASYSPKAREHAAASDAKVAVRVHRGSLDAPGASAEVTPSRESAPAWREYAWDDARRELKERLAGAAIT